jgi:membrane protein
MSKKPLGLRRLGREIADAFVEHNLLTYAAAISFQALVALIPLSLLGLGLLGALGQEEVWKDTIAPAIRGRVTPPVYHAIDYTAERVLSSGTAGLIAFAVLLSTWYLTSAVRAVMEALNRIHEVDDRRRWWARLGLAAALGVVCGCALIGSVLLLTAAPMPGGLPGVSAQIGRWVLALLLIGFAVGLLVRSAPAEHPDPRWASAGSLVVIGFWVVASIGFRFWVEYVADFRSPVGSLAGLLVLTGYLFASTSVFLVGVQLDELLRKETGGRARDLLAPLRSTSSRRRTAAS